MPDIDILSHGAIGNGTTNDSGAIQRAIDACHAAGGGRVIVPAGRIFLSGGFELKSNVELHVERGAILQCSGDPEHFPYRFPGYGGRPFITAYEAERIAITGAGVIDGGGRFYIEEDLGYIYRAKRSRPFTVFFVGYRNVAMRDIEIRDGAVWTVRLSGCADVLIHGIRILNDLKMPNSDAIDLDHCRNVRVSDCHIEAGDDCICLKTTKEFNQYGPCENITVTGCTLVSTSAALIIGCECKSVMRNIVFDACVITGSHRGLAVHLSDEADVENVTFSNMIVETRLFHHKWWGRAEPIYITSIPWNSQTGIGQVRNVRFVNVIARGENGVFIQGWEKNRIDGVLLENVRVELVKTSKWPGGTIDIRPSPADEGGPGPARELPAQPTHGIFVKNATNVSIRNCEVVWGPNPPDYFGKAIETIDIDNLIVENLRGGDAHG